MASPVPFVGALEGQDGSAQVLQLLGLEIEREPDHRLGTVLGCVASANVLYQLAAVDHRTVGSGAGTHRVDGQHYRGLSDSLAAFGVLQLPDGYGVGQLGHHGSSSRGSS